MNIRVWWERMRGARRKSLLAKRTRTRANERSGERTAERSRLTPHAAAILRQRPAIVAPIDDPIQARVDLVCLAAFAEAAAESMQTGPAEQVRQRFDEACLYFARAMEAAERAGLPTEIARLKLRVSAVKRLFGVLKKAEPKLPKPQARKAQNDSRPDPRPENRSAPGPETKSPRGGDRPSDL